VARYDRIARIESPERANAFAGWLALRDLEGHEREPEFGRRARLRFLALRPVRRLLTRGFVGVDDASLKRQIDGVREELGHLPGRDPERRLLADYLREVEGRDPGRLSGALLGLGDAAEGAGHGYAAEEFYRTALEITEAHGLPARRARSLCSLARLYGKRKAWSEATERFDEAGAAAAAAGDTAAWAEAICGLGLVQSRAGDAAAGRTTLAQVAARGEGENNDWLIAAAAAATCSLELAEGHTEAALEAGWRAVDLLPDSEAMRAGALLDLAAGFRRLGLREPAEACYRVVLGSPARSDFAVRGQFELALTAAEAGDQQVFDDRRNALVGSLDDADARLAADIHLGLGRASILLEDADGARAHLRQAMAIARRGGLGDAAVAEEDLLSRLESLADTALRANTGTPTPGIQTIARRVESLGRALVASG
jgi:tetratricopeptide (TPR) repeat protein